MEIRELIDAFREQLDEVENNKQQQISVSSLRIYLDALEKDAGSTQEFRNREHAGMLAHYAAKNQQSIEMLKAVLESGKSALHTLLIINGGAAVALLGAMSNLVGKTGGARLAHYLALPLLEFGVGVFLGAVGFALRYFSQDAYAGSENPNDKFEILGTICKVAAILSAIAGYVLFVVAVTNTYEAIKWSF